MSEIKIDAAVPLPTRARKSKYPWPDMKVGDSFFAPGVKNLPTTAARKTTGFKFTTAPEGDGVRVWRKE